MRLENGGLHVCRYEDVGRSDRRCDKQKADNGPGNRMFVIHLRCPPDCNEVWISGSGMFVQLEYKLNLKIR
jgi:hypothetical protein